jgi:hypothetical protein
MALLGKDVLYPKTLATFFALFWSFWTALGVLGIFQYFKSRLFLSETHVESIGVFKRKIIALDAVTRIAWRTRPSGGSIVVRTVDKRIVICFNNYSRSDRKDIVDFFRAKINHELQNGWDGFYKFISRRYEKWQGFSKLFFILNSIIVCVFGALFIYVWKAGSETRCLAIGIVNLIVALLLLWMAVKKRKPESRNPKLC